MDELIDKRLKMWHFIRDHIVGAWDIITQQQAEIEAVAFSVLGIIDRKIDFLQRAVPDQGRCCGESGKTSFHEKSEKLFNYMSSTHVGNRAMKKCFNGVIRISILKLSNRKIMIRQ